jgi:hypothetical protein
MWCEFNRPCFVWVRNLVSDLTGRLKVLGNTVLRRIFESKTEDVTGDSRKLNNWELHNFTPRHI